MNDSEIIKALECCSSPNVLKGCEDCPLKNKKEDCRNILDFKVLDLIKRQKAEIERLHSMNQAKLDMIHDVRAELETAKSEAVRKFAESLKRKSELVAPSVWATPYRAVAVAYIDRLLEGMGCNDD